MSLICTISNEVPEKPVLSPLSGCIFERRLIEKHIKDQGTDPVSGESITIEQLIEIKANPVVKPRPPQASSIPGILKMMQDEWDACMLQSFTVRQQLHTARQELSHALYQHDAACRVIARLTKEVTAAREALATLKPHTNVQEQTYAMDTTHTADVQPEEPGMTEQVLKKLADKAHVLTTARKQRGKSAPEGLATGEQIATYTETASHTGLHSASVPGLTCVDVKPSKPNLVLTGGNDKNAVLFDRVSEKIISTFKGHSKKITSVVLHPTENVCITASMDNNIRLWKQGQQAAVHVIKAHTGPVTDVSLHATDDYLLSVSMDEKWAFSDINTGQILCKVQDGDSPMPMTCAQLHPDGLIFGVGSTDSLVKIWDLKEQSTVAKFPGHSGAVRAIAFSENGYYLATAAEDSVVKLWDLRKLRNFKTIQLPNNYQVNEVCFDNSGTYLAVAGTDVRVYLCKQWQELVTFSAHADQATGVRFGDKAQFLASTGSDRALKIYGPPKSDQQVSDPH